MNKKITILPGDGIGLEVVEQAIKVLEAIGAKFDHQFEFEYGAFGGAAIDLFGSPLPEETLHSCMHADAVLLGAVGDPRYDDDPNAKLRPEQGLLGLRKTLQLFANIRPVKMYSSLTRLSPLKTELLDKVDFVIYRELTGGLYFGESGTSEDRQSAFDTCVYSASEIERIARLAFDHAMKRRKKLTLVDKSNVLQSSRLWRRVVNQIAQEYPEVSYDCLFVDHAAMQLIQHPGSFDILLTSNIFGDILSDQASAVVGSLGLMPSASVGIHTPVYEPIHGSYPEIAGKDVANPTGTILSAALMLEDFRMHKEANLIRFAVQQLLEKGVGTPDLNPRIYQSCSEFGDLVASLIEIGWAPDIDEDKLNERMSTII